MIHACNSVCDDVAFSMLQVCTRHIFLYDGSVYKITSQCTSQNKTRVTSVPGKDQVFTYNLKIINCAKKSVFVMKPLLCKLRLSELRECVKDEGLKM